MWQYVLFVGIISFKAWWNRCVNPKWVKNMWCEDKILEQKVKWNGMKG